MNKHTQRKKALIALGLVMVIAISQTVIINAAITNYLSNLTRVACVGDSITETSEYPEKLQSLLGSKYQVRNFGVSGSTVSLDSKIPYMEQPEFRWAVDFEPDIVFILLGTNDANPEIAYSEKNFEQDFAKIVSTFQQIPGTDQIIVMKSPPIFSTTSSYNNTYLVNDVIPRIESCANQMNLTMVDLYKAFENCPYYFSDGVHPTDEGSTLIADIVHNIITSNCVVS